MVCAPVLEYLTDEPAAVANVGAPVNVVVPPKVNVPVPVMMNWHPAPFVVTVPEIVAFPLEILRMSFRGVVVASSSGNPH